MSLIAGPRVQEHTGFPLLEADGTQRAIVEEGSIPFERAVRATFELVHRDMRSRGPHEGEVARETDRPHSLLARLKSLRLL